MNSYGQKLMENSWIIVHDIHISMGHFCKGTVTLKTSGNASTRLVLFQVSAQHHNVILTAKKTPSYPHFLTTLNGSGKLSINYYTANFLHSYLPLPQVEAGHWLTPLFFSSPIKYLNLSGPNSTMSSPHLPLLLQHLPIFPLSPRLRV